MAACSPSKQEEIFSLELPEITIYAKRIPGTPNVNQSTATMWNDNYEQTQNTRVVTP